MKIFITGGTGFIGSRLVNRLSKTDHELFCLKRTTSNVHGMRYVNLHWVEGDVNDIDSIRRGMHDCDWVVNLANVYSMWLKDPSIFERVNVQGTKNVMTCAYENEIKKFVHVSTVAVFGKPKDCPFNEESQPGEVLFSKYARTKSQGDEIVIKIATEHKVPFVILYPGIVLGYGDDKPSGQYIQGIVGRKVPSTIFNRTISTYVYVEDVVDAIIASLEKSTTSGKKYLIGKEQINGGAFAKMVSEISGVRLPLIHLPSSVVLAASYIFNALANHKGKEPFSGLSIDAGKTMFNGFQFDGSRAERELGLIYTPVRKALEEALRM